MPADGGLGVNPAGDPSPTPGAPVPILGNTTIVTGASEGIGRAVALDLAGAGAHVIAVARTEARLDELVEASEGSITAFPADLADADERSRLVANAGEVDVLVNNAGLA